MGHTGKPSRGCAVCRKRKIKCDENPGACSYCIKTKQKCPGYKNSFDLAWRDQRTTAKNNVERRIKATAKPIFVDSPSPNYQHAPISKASFEEVNLVTWENIPACFAQQTEDCAINFYFTSYGRAPPNRNEQLCGFQNLILPLFSSAAEDSALKLSTMALATLFFNTWTARQPENPRSRSYYVKALAAIKHQLKQEDSCTNDEIILSVLLLQLFEKLVVRPQKLQLSSSEARAHLYGALALVRHRGIHNFKDSMSQGLVFDIRSQLINLSFSDARRVDEDVCSWTLILDDDRQPPGVRLDSINVDLANLQADILNYDTLKHETGKRSFCFQAIDINNRLQDWEDSLPSSWLPIRVSGPSCIAPSISAAGLYQPYCTVHYSIIIAGIWNRYRTSRIRVLTILKACFPEDTIYQEQIQQLVDDICATVPIHLGNRVEISVLGDRDVMYPTVKGERLSEEHYTLASAKGGINLLSPLELLIRRTDLRQGQREWIGAQINRIFRLYRLGTT